MSDIQSIANGTFVIGQTSATNFVAGNGIKIDSPSEGVVRIGNDETVLFDGVIQGAGSTGLLSEPYKNFDRIKIFGNTDDEQGDYFPWSVDIKTPTGDGSTVHFGAVTTNNGWLKMFVGNLNNQTATTVTGQVLPWRGSPWGSLNTWSIKEIRGIGRKQA